MLIWGVGVVKIISNREPPNVGLAPSALWTVPPCPGGTIALEDPSPRAEGGGGGVPPSGTWGWTPHLGVLEKMGVEFKGDSLHDGFGGFDGFGRLWGTPCLYLLVLEHTGQRGNCDSFGGLCQERKSSPKSKFWGRFSGGRPRGYPGGRLVGKFLKLRSGPRNPGKTIISVRMSMTRTKARTSMAPGGDSKNNFGQQNFGLNFRSLWWSRS